MYRQGHEGSQAEKKAVKISIQSNRRGQRNCSHLGALYTSEGLGLAVGSSEWDSDLSLFHLRSMNHLKSAM